MSSLLNWKAQCNKKIKTQRDTYKKLTDEAIASNSSYTVPSGWIDILSDKECPAYYFGLHHKYLGIRLNQQRYSKLLGCRDIILSSIMSRARVPADAGSSTIYAITIIDLFCDVGGWKSGEVVQGHLYQILRNGLKSIRGVFSLHSAETVRTKITSEISPSDIPRFFPMGELITTLWTNFLNGNNIDGLTHEEVDQLILVMCVLEVQYSKNDLECSLLHLLMAIVKTGTVSSEYVDRRYESLTKLATGTGLIFADSDTESIEIIWKVINFHLLNENSTINFILDNILKITNVIDNVVLKPMPTFLAYRGLTPIVNITTAINNFPTFPWRALIKTNSTIKAEFIILKNILQVCQDDVLLGYKISGAGTAVPHLSYLSVCLLIEAGGSETLKAYKGIGPQNKARVTSAIYLDSLVEKFKVDLLSGQSNYEALKKTEEKLKDILARTGLTSLMASFLSASASNEESNNDEIRDSDFDYSSSDDDNDDPPPPRPQDPKRKRRDTSSPDDKPDYPHGRSHQRGASRSLPRGDRAQKSPRKTYRQTTTDDHIEKYADDYDDRDGAGGSGEVSQYRPVDVEVGVPLEDLLRLEETNGALVEDEDELMVEIDPKNLISRDCEGTKNVRLSSVPSVLRRLDTCLKNKEGFIWTYPGENLKTSINLVTGLGTGTLYAPMPGNNIFPVFISMLRKMQAQKTAVTKTATLKSLLEVWPLNAEQVKLLIESKNQEFWTQIPVEFFHDGTLLTSVLDQPMLDRLSVPLGYLRKEESPEKQPASN